MSEIILTQTSQFNANVVTFDAMGVMGSAVPAGVTNIDLKISGDHYITGGQLRVQDAAFGDFCHVQIMDLDNVIGYGAGVMLRQFVTNWYLSDKAATQADIDLPYPAKIVSGLYIRLVYNSIAASDAPSPRIVFNYTLHRIIPQP